MEQIENDSPPKTPDRREPTEWEKIASPTNLMESPLGHGEDEVESGPPKTPEKLPRFVLHPNQVLQVVIEEGEEVDLKPFEGIDMDVDQLGHWDILKNADESSLMCDDTLKPWIVLSRKTRDRLIEMVGGGDLTWAQILEAAREYVAPKFFNLLGRKIDPENLMIVQCIGFEENFRSTPDGLDFPGTISIPESTMESVLCKNARDFHDYDSQVGGGGKTWKKTVIAKSEEKCRTCGESFESTVARDFHRAMVHPWGPHICSFCGLYTTQRDRMCKTCHLRADRSPLDVIEAIGTNLLTVAAKEKKRRIEFGLQQISEGYEVMSDLDLHNNSKGKPRGKQSSSSGVSSASSSITPEARDLELQRYAAIQKRKRNVKNVIHPTTGGKRPKNL